MALFDDQFALADPFGGQRPRAGAAPAIPSLPPEEEQSALAKIADLGLGGLGFVGGILNKPGRVIRGLLGGQPRELLNAIPFSDSLGITDPSQQVHGTDLLGISRDQADQAGFFSPEGLGGFGVELATDPLNFLSFGGGALTKVGQLASKAGVLPKNISGIGGRLSGLAAGSPEAAAVANKAAQLGQAGVTGTERLGGHVGAGLLFMGNNFGTFDLGPTGNAIGGALAKYPKGAGAALGAGVGALSGAMNEDGNPLTGAITGGVAGALTGAGAEKFGAPVADFLNRGRHALFTPEVMGQWTPKGQEMAREIYAARQAAKEGSLANDVLPVARAGGADLLTDTQGARTLAEGGMGPTSAGTQQAFPIMESQLEKARLRAEAVGMDVPKIEKYFPRQAVNAEWDVGRPGGHGTGGALAPFSTSMLERDPLLRDLPTATIEAMVADPRLTSKIRTAATNADAAKIIASQYGLADRADGMAGFLHSLDARRLKSGLFGRHAVTDYESAVVGLNQAAGAGEKMLEQIAREASNVQGPGAKTYQQVIADLGLGNTSVARANVQQQMVALGKSPIGDQYLSRETADALTRATKAYTTPEVLAPVVKFIDNFTNFLKGGLTSPFPSFNIRNLASGAWQNYVLMGAKDLPEAYQASATALREGGVVPGIANALFKGQGLSDAAATRKFSDIIFSKGITGGGVARDVVGADAAEELLMRLPGAMPGRKPGLEMFPQAAKDFIPTSLGQANPLNIRGVNGRTKSLFSPVAAGQKIGNEIEDMGRIAGMYGLMKQGYEPGVAADMVKAMHVDYSHSTGFEKNVMKRLIPFYGWMRGNLPEQIRQVVENPGGPAAMAVKGSEAANRGQFVPDYLGQGVTIPLGNEEAGQRRYLTRTGLPFEDLGQTSMRSILGSLNPLLRYPLEQATGRQMFSDRDLRDLHSRVGDLVPGGVPPPLENLLMNSPLSRLITTASTIADERKSLLDKFLNLGTGLKISDVDVNQARRNVTRDFINANLRGPSFRHFDELSVRPEALPLLSPRELELFRLHLTQDRRSTALGVDSRAVAARG